MEIIYNINTPLVSGNITRVVPNIYAVVIKNDYDRGMLFCRYQEYYESQYKEIRGKFFTLEYFMKLYVKKNKKQFFTYHDDFAGYNIPSHKFKEAYELFKNCDDEYNSVMKIIFEICSEHSKSDCDFYVIGIDKTNGELFEHEFAHALYYTNKEYKRRMDYIINNIDKNIFLKIKGVLIKIGYSNKNEIIYDEIQAYLSTGLVKQLNLKSIKPLCKEFSDIYGQFRKI